MRLLCVLLAVLCSCGVIAQENGLLTPSDENQSSNPSTSEKLTTLIVEGKYAQAFSYASIQTDLLGDPSFDFLLGIAALRSAHPHEAVFAFERVVANVPKWTQAHIQLANAFIKSNNLPAAQTVLTRLKSQRLTEPQLTTVTKLNVVIDRQLAKQSSQLTNIVSVAMGYDSNINAGTTEDAIFIPSLNSDVPLSDGSQETSGHYINLSYSGRYSKVLSQKSEIRLDWGAVDFQYADLGRFNRTVAYGAAQYRYIDGENTYFAGVNVTPLLLKGQFYRLQSTVNLGVDHQVNDKLFLTLNGSIGKVNNNIADTLDINVNNVTVGTKYVTAFSMHKFGVDFMSENAEIQAGDYNAKDSVGIAYQYARVLTESSQYIASLSLKEQTFDDRHPLFLVQRKETLKQISNTVRVQLNKDIAIQALLSYQDKSSNLGLYEYDRIDAAVSLSYQF